MKKSVLQYQLNKRATIILTSCTTTGEKSYNEKDIIAQWNADMYDLNETITDDLNLC